MGNNYSVLDHVVTSFNYEEIEVNPASAKRHFKYAEQELHTVTPILKDWIAEFVMKNPIMYTSEPGQNKLIEEVMKLLQCLIKFGCYVNDNDIYIVLGPLLAMLDGRTDLPFSGGDKTSKGAKSVIKQYQIKDRYQPNPRTRALINAKCQ